MCVTTEPQLDGAQRGERSERGELIQRRTRTQPRAASRTSLASQGALCNFKCKKIAIKNAHNYMMRRVNRDVKVDGFHLMSFSSSSAKAASPTRARPLVSLVTRLLGLFNIHLLFRGFLILN